MYGTGLVREGAGRKGQEAHSPGAELPGGSPPRGQRSWVTRSRRKEEGRPGGDAGCRAGCGRSWFHEQDGAGFVIVGGVLVEVGVRQTQERRPAPAPRRTRLD